MTSSWRRNADEAIPARGKIVGGYVNMAFQKSEAELNGYRRGARPDRRRPRQRGVGREPVHRPRRRGPHPAGQRRPARGRHPQGDHRAAAPTRASRSRSRSIDRSELYVADEVFLCGTGVQISPVIEVDHRPVGSGAIGPIGRLIRDRYFDAVRGRLPRVRALADADRLRLRPPRRMAGPRQARGGPAPRASGVLRADGDDDVRPDGRVVGERGRHPEQSSRGTRSSRASVVSAPL